MAVTSTKWLDVFSRFIEHIRIVSKEVTSADDRGVKLVLWGSQRYFLEQMCSAMDRGVRQFYCLKARQLGESTISAAIVVEWLALHPNMIGVLVTDDDGNRDAMRDLLRRFVNSIPDEFTGGKFHIKPGQDNKGMMGFSNGARLDFLVAGHRKKPNWGEGRGYTLAWLTEVGKYGDPVGLQNFEEALAQENPDRLVIYESTGNGYNHWRDRYMQAKKDTATKCAIFVPWCTKELNRIKSDDPRFEIYGAEPPSEDEQERIDLVKKRYGFDVSMEQLAWYRWKQDDDSQEEGTLAQNNPWTEEDAFQLSGHSFFRIMLVQRDLTRIYDTPIYYQGYRYQMTGDFFETRLEQITEESQAHRVELKVWYPPVANGKYVIGLDPAYGRNDEKDCHTIYVGRCFADKVVQCAEYATYEVETWQAAWVLFHLAGCYRDCIINVELSGGPGRAVMREFQRLRELLEAEIYIAQVGEMGWSDVIGNARWFLYNRADSLGSGFAYNSDTTAQIKFELMNLLRDTYTTGQSEVNSAALLEEMQTIVQDGSEIGAPKGVGGKAKDDRTMAFALANFPYTRWQRPLLLAQGVTYDLAMGDERREAPDGEKTVSNIVRNFFRTQQARLEAAREPDAFLAERGLE